MTEPAPAEIRPVTQAEVMGRVRRLGGRIVRIAIWAGVLYTLLIPLGLVAGGYGGGMLAAHFELIGWYATGAKILGVITGGVAGFIIAQLAIADMISEAVIGSGLSAGEMGLRSLLRLLKQARAQKEGEASKPHAALESAIEKSHKAVNFAGRFFGNSEDKS